MINWLRASTKGGTPDSKYSVPKDATPSWSSDEGGKTWKTDSWTTFGTNAGVFFCLDVCVNDPSAGSPTETLLRLLLPRNVQI